MQDKVAHEHGMSSCDQSANQKCIPVDMLGVADSQQRLPCAGVYDTAIEATQPLNGSVLFHLSSRHR